MPTSRSDHRNDVSDPGNHARIQAAIDGFGRWSEGDARQIANALYSEVKKDPLMRGIDAVRTGTDALGTESIFAIYSPHGPVGPFFHASVKVQAALAAAIADSTNTGIDSTGFLADPSILKHPVPELTERNRQLADHNAIVMHRTAGNSAVSDLDAFKSGIGAHFIIDKDGSIFQTASLDKQVAHVGKIKSRCDEEGTCAAKEQAAIDEMGWAPSRIHAHESKKSYPDRYPLNADSIGIEVVGNYNEANKEWESPTSEQLKSIARLAGILKNEYGLNDKDIYQHDIVSYKTKGEGANLYFPDTPAMPVSDGVSPKGPHR